MRICTCELVSSACLAATAWASVRSAQFFGRGTLAVIGFQLLDAQLAHAELFQQGFDFARAGTRFGRVGFPDQNVHAFNVEIVETLLQFVARFDLDFIAMLQ